MNLTEFYDVYKLYGNRDKITIQCNKDGCFKTETLNKDSAIRNIKQNGCFLCRSCCYTEEGLKRISEATSYKRSEETKRKMSEAKLAFYQTPAGQEFKNKLSRLTAGGHANNKYENAKRNGWYPSEKMGERVFYGSSYELRLCVELDEDKSVEKYETQIPFNINDRGRCLDFLITYKGGTKKAIEVKPEGRLNEQAVVEQINDSREYTQQMGWEFDVYTEIHFGMTDRQIRDWADILRTKLGDFDWVEFRKGQNRKKANKHYNKCISTDKITVHCAFCGCDHEALRLTYEKNIARNKRYICEREGGFIAGSKPKKKKVNPYAGEGKKECTKCGGVKIFGDFNSDKSRSDGYSNICRECNQRKCNERYERRK